MPEKVSLSPINFLRSIETLLDAMGGDIPPATIHRMATLIKGTKHIYDGSPIEMLHVKLCEETGANQKTVHRWIWRWLLDQKPKCKIGVEVKQDYPCKVWSRLNLISQAGDIE